MLRKVNLQLLAENPPADPTPADPAAKPAADPAGGADGQQTNPEGKTFTQKEVDDVVKNRLERERKKLPTDAELQAFNEWRKTQKPAETDPAVSELQKNYEAAKAELESLKRKDFVIGKNVNPKFAEFVVFSVSKQVTDKIDFEDAFEVFEKANPDYFTGSNPPPAAPAGAQGQRQAGAPGKLSGVEDEFYRKNPDLKPKG